MDLDPAKPLQNQPSVDLSVAPVTPDSTPYMRQKHFWQLKSIILLPLLLFLVCLLAAGYVLSQQPVVQKLAINVLPLLYPSTHLNRVEPSPVPTASPLSILTDSLDLQKRIFFLRKPDKNKADLVEGWTILPNAGNEQKVDLPLLSFGYKWPESSLVFYSTTDNTDTVFVKNLNTLKTESIQPIQGLDPQVIVNINLSGLNYSSSDGKYFIFSVGFEKACPTEVDGRPVTRTDSGPCLPDPMPNVPQGMYLYDMSTQTKTLLSSENSLISNWDLVNMKLYFIHAGYNGAGLDEIDLQTKQIKRIENAKTFGYAAFPMDKTNQLIRIAAETSDSGTVSSFSSISVIDRSTNQATEIDSGAWGDIQPFASFSPDQKYVLYERTFHLEGGMSAERIYRLEPTTGQKKQLTPDSITESYSVRGVWLDAQTYITLVDTIEKEYYNGNNFLVSIDVVSGKITRLTPKNDVYRFSSF